MYHVPTRNRTAATIFVQVKKHDENVALGAVGSGFFLQFIGPVLACPQKISRFESQPVPKAVKRGLLLLSKILAVCARRLAGDASWL